MITLEESKLVLGLLHNKNIIALFTNWSFNKNHKQNPPKAKKNKISMLNGNNLSNK